MRKNNLHRILSFVMAMIMVLSLSPVSVYAVEEEHIHEEHIEAPVVVEQQDVVSDITTEEAATEPAEPVDDGSAPADTEQASEISDAVYQSIAAAEEVLYRYWNPDEVPAESIDAFVNAMDVDSFISALIDFEDTNFLLQDLLDFDNLNDAEKALLEATVANYDRFWFALEDRAETEELYGAYANKGSIGGLSITSSNTSGSVSTGGDAAAGTGTVTVSISARGGVTSAKTAESTFTFLNDSGSTLQLTFDYAISDATSSKVNGSTASTGTNISIKLENGKSFTVYLKATGAAFFGTANATCSISKMKVETVLDSAQLTIDFDSNLGTMKDKSGNAINPNSAVTVPLAGLEVTPSPKSGNYFVAWVDPSNNAFISSVEKRLFQPTAATMTAKAIFSDGTPWFIVNGSTLVEGWDAAMAYGGRVVLINDAVLKARTEAYVVPSNVELLIPFSDAHFGMFGAIPNPDDDAVSAGAMTSTTAATCFMNLTVESGAKIEVNGKLNVNGQRNVANQGTTGTGTAKGGHSQITLNGTGTQMTFNSGSVLTCYGFIAGTGGVELKSGSKLYELLQVYDWGGGSNLSGWYLGLGNKANQTMFFTAHYYLQNVEAPLTVNYGAVMYGEAVLTVSGVQITSSAQVVGTESTSNTLFKLGTGTYLTRAYRPSTDRVEYCLKGSGNAGFGSLNVAAKVGLEVNLNSKDYILPVNNAMTLRVGSGVTMDMPNRIAVMPGAKIIIDQGATINLSQNAFIFDKADKTSGTGGLFFAELLAPQYTAGRGTKAKITANNESGYLEVNGTLNVTGSGGLYTTSNGGTSTDKIICGTGTIKHSGTTGSGSLRGGFTSSFVTVATVDALMNLAGDGDMKNITKNSYKGLGADHGNKWYIVGNTGDVAATCVDDAYTKYWCSSADAAYTVVKSGTATGVHTPTAEGVCAVCGAETCKHVEVEVRDKVDVTCTTNGYTGDTYCKNCGFKTATGTTIEAQGHKEQTAATCTAQAVCSVCGQPYGSTLDHSYNQNTVKEDALKSEANCASPAVYYKSCSCGDVDKSENAATFTDGEKAPTKHTGGTEDVQAVEATCVNNGYTAGVKCLGCGNVLSGCEDLGLNAENHKNKTTVTVEPTCVTAGSTTVTCNDCGDTVSESTIPAQGHSYTVKGEELTKATCKDFATYEAKCERCGDVSGTIPGTELNPSNHTGDTELLGYKEASCTEDGYTGDTYCKGCNTKIADGEPIPVKDHELKATVIDPTCTEQGYTLKACKNCDHSYKESYVDATGHTYSASWKWDDNKYILTLSCENCDDEVTEDGEVTVPESEKSATCSTPGEVVYKVTVSVSGVQFTGTNTVTVPATGHTYDEPTWKFTKTDDSATAVATFTCSECEAGVDDHSVSVTATEVTEAAGKVLPTCVSEGSVQYTATVMLNNKSYTGTSEAFTLAKPDHNKTFTAANTATCVDTGNKDYWYCASCKIFYKDEACTEAYGKDEHILPIDLDNGHDYDDGWKKNDTHHWHECANDCGIEGSKDEHNWVPATVDAPETCSVCSKTRGQALTAVAKIGEQKFETLEAAVEAAQEGDTIVLLADAQPAEAVVLHDGVTLNLNGFKLTAAVSGKVSMNNGTWITPADGGQFITMASPNAPDAMYHTNNAVIELAVNWNLNVVSGEVTLANNWRTLPNQLVTVSEGATFIIPANKTFTVLCDAVVEGNLNSEGSIVLGEADATLTMAKVDGLNITVKEGVGDCVLYVDDKYVVHSHTWVNADCDTPKTCSVCNATEGDALGHSYTGEVTKAATCTEDGVKTFTCTCGDSYTEAIAKLGHELVDVEGQAATCTEDGYTAYKDCSRCDYIEGKETIAAAGHKYTETVTKAATCTEDGVKTFTCTCGDSYTEAIAKLGHELVDVEGQAATCTEDGYTAYKDCSRCDYIEGKETIAAAGHKYTETVTKEATCTEDGVKTFTCTCGDSYTEAIAKLGHELVDVEGQAATCTEDGYTAYKDCSRCDYIEGKTVISAVGHSYGESVTKEASCTEDGVKTFTCVCGDNYTEEIAALGHDEVAHEAKAPTCTAIGWDAYVTCSRCDYTTYVEKTALGHKAGAAVVENKKAATCTVDGSYDEVVYCFVESCKEEISRETKAVKAEGHKYVDGECGVCHIVCTHETYGEDGKCVECGMEKPVVIQRCNFAAIEVSFDSELLLWLKFTFPDELINDANAYIVIDKDGADWNIQQNIIKMSDMKAKGTDARGRYIVEQGMAGPEMTKNVTVTIYDGNGNKVEIVDYVDGSVKTSLTRNIIDYAKLALEKGTPAQKELVSAALIYGGYSQKYFGVATNDLAYSVLPSFGISVPAFQNITHESINQVLETNGVDIGITQTTQQAFLDSSIYHRVYFVLDKGKSIEDFKFTLTYMDAYKKEHTKTLTPVYESARDRYYVDIEDIPSPLLDYMYKIEITSGASESYIVKTSVMAWIKLCLEKSSDVNQRNMAKAMYNYNQVANKFFGM